MLGGNLVDYRIHDVRYKIYSVLTYRVSFYVAGNPATFWIRFSHDNDNDHDNDEYTVLPRLERPPRLVRPPE